MSFGIGIGDIITVFDHANRLRKDFSTAPAQYQAIATEVKNFYILVNDINTYFEGHSPTEAQGNELSEIILGCTQTLLETEKILTKYSSLESGRQPIGVKGYTKRVWQRVKLDSNDIRDFRNRITANISLLSAYVDGFERRTLTELVSKHDDLIDKQRKRQSLQENQELLDWLAPADYTAQHSNHVGHRLADTGQWFLKSPEFIWWSNKDHESNGLYLHGIPGGGKTILSSIIIDELQAKYSLNDDIGICYYYCDYNRQEDQRLEQILLRLLRQLANTAGLAVIKDLYTNFTRLGTRPALSAIKGTLHNTLKRLSSTFIVVDALDECQSIGGCQKALFAELSELNRLEDANIKIIITSRQPCDVKLYFRGFKSVEVLANDQDIGKYITSHVDSLPNFVATRLDLQEEIKAAIINAVGGMFLLATLHFRALHGKRSVKQLRSTLDSLSSSSYPEAYTTTMNRICSQVEDQKNLALDTLTWIVYAKRSLTSAELLHALAVEIDSPEFDDDNIPDIQDVLSACCGLVVVEPETQFVRLVHQTTQDFLKGRGSTWLPKAHTKLSKICNTYLAFKDLVSAKNDTEGLQDLLGRYHLYDYASWHWLDHAQSRDDLGVEELVINQKQIDKSSEVLMTYAVPEYLNLRQQYPGITGLHLLAYCGLTEMMPKFLERYDVNEVDQSGQTPLSYAFQADEIEAASVLIENGARLEDRYKEVDEKMVLCSDHSIDVGNNLLLHAINHDKRGMIHLFMEVNAKLDVAASRLGRTLLSVAAVRGDIKIIQFLIEHGADINHINVEGSTPVLSACANDHQEVVRHFVERGADLNIGDESGITPLHVTAGKGYTELVELLLDKDIDVDAMTLTGYTPIYEASFKGHLDVVRLLLDRGADTNKTKNRGWLPLQAASQEGHLDIVRLLLDRGADIERSDDMGLTPLLLAVAKGHLDIVQFLLEKGADVSKADNEGRTPLVEASSGGFFDIVRLLLDKGAAVDGAANEGAASLAEASEEGHFQVVRLLLDRGTDVNIGDHLGWTSLHFASRRGHIEIVRLLLNKGAKVSSSTLGGATPLHLAASKRHLDILSLLLDRGANPNAKDKDHCGPLFIAALGGGHIDIFRLLLQKGASFMAKNMSKLFEDRMGRNIFHCTARGGNVAIMKYLLQYEPLSVLEDKFGRNVLDYASMADSPAMVNFILKFYQTKGIKIESSSPWSPLHWACRMAWYDTLRLLTEAGIKCETVETAMPAVHWSPFDLAVYWNNRNLVSKKGEMDDTGSWLRALIPKTHASHSISPPLKALDTYRSNHLTTQDKSSQVCHGCFMYIYGVHFRCTECENYSYCFLCKHSADMARPEHDWELIEPDDPPEPEDDDGDDASDRG